MNADDERWGTFLWWPDSNGDFEVDVTDSSPYVGLDFGLNL